jgi:D-alanyl-D-alanine carboxypeptidase (penicillin-binding protein 5/6)
VSVEELLRGVIIQSGNDACIVLAEGLASSESAFAEEMTKRGRALGLTNSTFINASGWPHEEHLTTPHDLAILAKHLIDDFPEYYKIYSEKEFTYNGIKQGNRNPLLYKDNGTDGLKTGHTEAAGYGLVASAKRGERRLILVLNGMKSVNERSREAERLMDWGFREFGNYALFKSGDTIAEAPVWLGDKASVPLVAEKNVVATMTRKSRNGMQVKVKYDEPIAAPVVKGAKVGTIQITAPDMAPVEMSLLAGADVEQLGVLGRLGAAISYLVMGPPAPSKN